MIEWGPLPPSSTGKYSTIDWAVMGDGVNYTEDWKNIVKGDKRFMLQAQPLDAVNEVGAFTIFLILKRENSYLHLTGSAHKWQWGGDEETCAPVKLEMSIQLQFITTEGDVLKLEQQGIVTFHATVSQLTRFSNVYWECFSVHSLPRAIVILRSPDASEFEQSFSHMKCL